MIWLNKNKVLINKHTSNCYWTSQMLTWWASYGSQDARVNSKWVGLHCTFVE